MSASRLNLSHKKKSFLILLLWSIKSIDYWYWWKSAINIQKSNGNTNTMLQYNNTDSKSQVRHPKGHKRSLQTVLAPVAIIFIKDSGILGARFVKPSFAFCTLDPVVTTLRIFRITVCVMTNFTLRIIVLVNFRSFPARILLRPTIYSVDE